MATRTDPKHCACASATRESVSDYLMTRVVDFVCSASERGVEIWIQRLPLDERDQAFCAPSVRTVWRFGESDFLWTREIVFLAPPVSVI
ncbi:hypothetical protein TNCV_2201961 [Trichonephila clavipes]|uniref:Uncharacterized protein n=1 Tax=Trichonephila clavipes TaxID=2585209 RepID=A0A8X6V157_TRICX|nr:hypothetical protein TNCV_2201961 [Trichonephila clavipes]